MNSDIPDRIESALRLHINGLPPEALTKLHIYPLGVLITYGDLCHKSGIALSPQSLGRFLSLVAAKTGQPIDALVVNKKTNVPGGKYRTDTVASKSEWKQAVLSATAYLLARK